MDSCLVAEVDSVVSIAGYDEICRALRGCAEKTPPLPWILKRNQLKRKLKSVFPFSTLYTTLLDAVIEGFRQEEFPPHAPIVNATDESGTFRVVVEGEAVRRAEGSQPESLKNWACFGE